MSIVYGNIRPTSRTISTYSSSFEDQEDSIDDSPVLRTHQKDPYYSPRPHSVPYTAYTTRYSYLSTPRRMTNTVRSSNRSAILAVGEELRQLLHAEDPPILKDRRYHLKTYSTCFVGHEMVDWLLKKGEVESRAEAVAMMQKLLENEVIHHGRYLLILVWCLFTSSSLSLSKYKCMCIIQMLYEICVHCMCTCGNAYIHVVYNECV